MSSVKGLIAMTDLMTLPVVLRRSMRMLRQRITKISIGHMPNMWGEGTVGVVARMPVDFRRHHTH